MKAWVFLESDLEGYYRQTGAASWVNSEYLLDVNFAEAAGLFDGETKAREGSPFICKNEDPDYTTHYRFQEIPDEVFKMYALYKLENV